MEPIDYFAWFVFLSIVVSIVAAFIALAQLRGKIAAARNHPQADAINAAGWLGLLTVCVVWVRYDLGLYKATAGRSGLRLFAL